MSAALTTAFGNEISVSIQPRDLARQFSGYSGADGLTTMDLGTRGHAIVVEGLLRGTGGSYAAARAALLSIIEGIETNYLFADADDYTFQSDTYSNVVWQNFQLLPGTGNRLFRQTAEGDVIVGFRCTGRALI